MFKKLAQLFSTQPVAPMATTSLTSDVAKVTQLATPNTAPAKHLLIDYENLCPENLNKLTKEDWFVWLFVGKLQNKINTGLMKSIQAFGEQAKVIYVDISKPNALDFHIAYYLGSIAQTYPQAQVTVLSKDKGYDSILAHMRESTDVMVNRWDSNTCVEQPTASQTHTARITKTSRAPKSRHAYQRNGKAVAQSHEAYDHFANDTNVSMANTVTHNSHDATNFYRACFRQVVCFITDNTVTMPTTLKEFEADVLVPVVEDVHDNHQLTLEESQVCKIAEKLAIQLQKTRLVDIDDSQHVQYLTSDDQLFERLTYFVNRERPNHVVPLKQMVVRYYQHTTLTDSELFHLIERLKQAQVLSIARGGHIHYNQALEAVIDTDSLLAKAKRFIERGHALPSIETALVNTLMTHLSIRGKSRMVESIIERLMSESLLSIDANGSVSYGT